ncbi:hypothetical protein ACFLUP_04590 [Chloroflexota bacterium]
MQHVNHRAIDVIASKFPPVFNCAEFREFGYKIHEQVFRQIGIYFFQLHLIRRIEHFVKFGVP